MDVLDVVRNTLGTYDEGDVRAMLADDHEAIRELAKELSDAATVPARRALLARLRPLLTAHTRAEEHAVYMRLARDADSPDARMAGYEGAVQHTLVDVLLTRLADTRNAAADLWTAHAKVLHELLERHIDAEEDRMFEALGDHFSAEVRREMGSDFLEQRDELLRAAPALHTAWARTAGGKPGEAAR